MKSRTLFYFPIVHSQPEMGGLGQTIVELTQRKLGRRVWRHKVDLVGRFWAGIEHIVFNDLALPYMLTRVYQDGLPVCDKEDEIVAEIARMGSPNHQLLLRLKEKGATVIGTESAELLIEEYLLAKKNLEDRNALEIDDKQKATSDALLEKRDIFIAARIDQTLREGETGILFLGMLHNPIAYLPEDIQVIYPLGNLPDDRASGPGKQ